MLQPFELNYTNVNLLVFLFIIPIAWSFILDRKFNFKWTFKASFLILIILASTLHFTGAIDLFQAGVDFCQRMMKVHNCTYAESCVIWCILFPLSITIILAALPARGNSTLKSAEEISDSES